MQEAVFGMCDTDGDAKISVDEFVKFNMKTGAALSDQGFRRQAEQWQQYAAK